MKILSDFDGVMTDQTEEGHTELRLFREELARLAGERAPHMQRCVEQAIDALGREPSRHGWWWEKRLSAYADEDLFIRVIAVAGCLDGWARAGREEVQALIPALQAAGYASFTAVSDWAYHQVVEHTRRGDIQPVDPVVRGVVMDLLSAGHQVVVVSNSATDRVLELLSRLDLPAMAHEVDPKAPLRVRGNAKKFALGNAPQSRRWGELGFDVDRPAYRTILAEEQPQVVIGDVFSLDLALPLALCEEQALHARLLLRTRPYTPPWAKTLMATAHPRAALGMLHAFDELPQALGLSA